MLFLEPEGMAALMLASLDGVVGFGESTTKRDGAVVADLGGQTCSLVEGMVLNAHPLERLLAPQVRFHKQRQASRCNRAGESRGHVGGTCEQPWTGSGPKGSCSSVHPLRGARPMCA